MSKRFGAITFCLNVHAPPPACVLPPLTDVERFADDIAQTTRRRVAQSGTLRRAGVSEITVLSSTMPAAFLVSGCQIGIGLEIPRFFDVITGELVSTRNRKIRRKNICTDTVGTSEICPISK